MYDSDPTKAGIAILEVVENQLATNEPPKVKETFDRLISLGISKQEARKYIACALSVEVFGVIKNQEEYNPHRYEQNLDKLPEMPWGDE